MNDRLRAMWCVVVGLATAIAAAIYGYISQICNTKGLLYIRSPIDIDLTAGLLAPRSSVQSTLESGDVVNRLCDERRIFDEHGAEFEKYRLLVERTRDIILIFERLTLTVTYANVAASRAYGFSNAELIGMPIEQLRAPQTLTTISHITTIIDDVDLVFETLHRRRDGSCFPVEVSSQSAILAGRHVILSSIRDISDRRRAIAAMEKTNELQGAVAELKLEAAARDQIAVRLEHAAYHDALTGLPNRAAILRLLEVMYKASRSKKDYHYAVLFLDVNGMKAINDGHGHAAGDEFLVAIAALLCRCMRGDDFVGRLGGDEFVCLVRCGTLMAEPVEIAMRVAAEFDPGIRVGSSLQTDSTMSIGIAYDRSEHTTYQDILRDADKAMYQAKRDRATRYLVFDPLMV